MIQSPIPRIRSYADALFAGFTKTARNGRKLIYPWGFFVRGYVIASEKDEKRLKRQYTTFLILVPIVMGAGYTLWGNPGLFAAAALILVSYAIYATRLTASMEASGEGLSLEEAYRAQARKFSSALIWSWTIGGIFLVCFGIVASVTAPEHRLAFLSLILIGGFQTAVCGWMLMLRRGPNPPSATVVVDSVMAEESATLVAGGVGPVRAWFLTIVGLLFTAMFIFLAVVDPEERSKAVGGAAMLGLVAAFGIAVLVSRYRSRPG